MSKKSRSSLGDGKTRIIEPRAKVAAILKQIGAIDGVYVNSLVGLVDGTVSIIGKKNLLRIQIGLPLDEMLDKENQDVRHVMAQNWKMFPVLVFIDPAE